FSISAKIVKGTSASSGCVGVGTRNPKSAVVDDVANVAVRMKCSSFRASSHTMTAVSSSMRTCSPWRGAGAHAWAERSGMSWNKLATTSATARNLTGAIYLVTRGGRSARAATRASARRPVQGLLEPVVAEEHLLADHERGGAEDPQRRGALGRGAQARAARGGFGLDPRRGPVDAQVGEKLVD